MLEQNIWIEHIVIIKRKNNNTERQNKTKPNKHRLGCDPEFAIEKKLRHKIDIWNRKKRKIGEKK